MSDSAQQRFDELYRRTRSEVLAYLVARCASAEEAADALAETFLRAWEKRNTLNDDQHARLWLYRTARNVSLQEHRRRRVADGLVQRLSDEISETIESADDRSRDEQLHAALRTLGSVEREIIMLTAWDGLAPREIAVVLGISANAVRIRLHRARGNVRKALDQASATSSGADNPSPQPTTALSP